jgi:hypothetical protein
MRRKRCVARSRPTVRFARQHDRPSVRNAPIFTASLHAPYGFAFFAAAFFTTLVVAIK